MAGLMTAICNCEDTCIGLRLAGIKAHFEPDNNKLFELLHNVANDGTQTLIVSKELAETEYFINFETTNPQVVVIKI